MFFVAGTKGVTSTVTSGLFHCPNCAEITEYLHKEVRKAATLFFIPVAQLGLLGEYIECQRCQCTFELGVLSYDPEKEQKVFLAEYHRAMKRVLITMMLADGKIDNDELKLIKHIYKKIIGQKYSDDEIKYEIQQCKNNPQSLYEYLFSVEPKLNESGKELIIKVAYWVSVADGEYGKEEEGLLKLISMALSVSKAHLNGIINELNKELEELK